MRFVVKSSWVLSLAVLLVGGCQGVTTSTTAPLTLAVVGKDTEDGPRVALEGARLCQTDTPNCDFSDANGRVSIELPIGEEVSYTLQKQGYASYLVPVFLRAAAGSSADFGMASNQLMVARHQSVMSPYPMIDTGTIVIESMPGRAGATFELVDATGEAFYVDEEGVWRSDLKETAMRGWGGFVEVPPGGAFQIVLGGSAINCVPNWAWPSDAENAFRFPIRENHLTYVNVSCALSP